MNYQLILLDKTTHLSDEPYLLIRPLGCQKCLASGRLFYGKHLAFAIYSKKRFRNLAVEKTVRMNKL